jgi:ribosomal protein S18 acetylase RimI-like enzyme
VPRGHWRELEQGAVAARVAVRELPFIVVPVHLEQPFLHAWKSNAAAITLYETLGFRIRCEVNVAVLEKPPD